MNKEEKLLKRKAYRLANKEQLAAESKTYRQSHKKEKAAYMKVWRAENKVEIVAYRKAYRAENRGMIAGYNKAYGESNPEKLRAHKAVSRAVGSGKLIKPTNCTVCNKGSKLDGHHRDYSKPLEVLWLCPQCHTEEHQRLKNQPS